jgi:ornithine cyclodeaminase
MDDFTGDLGEVILGRVPGRENDDEIIVFKTVGIGTQDLVTAKRIYDRAVDKGIGTSWG